MREALSAIDDERLNHNTKFCKFIVNVAPFDALIASVRERASVNSKRLGFEDKLASFLDGEAYKKLKQVMEKEDFDLAEGMAQLLSFADKYEIFCRDIPTGHPHTADGLVEALKTHFQSIVKMWAPFVQRTQTMAVSFGDAMKDLLKGTADSGPDKAKLQLLILNGTTCVYSSGLQRCIGIVTRACMRAGSEKPGEIKEQLLALAKAAAVEGLAHSCTDLCTLEGGVVIKANPPLSPHLIGEA